MAPISVPIIGDLVFGIGNSSGFWNQIKNVARTIGNYILVPCGGGSFTYGGVLGDGGGPVAVGFYGIVSADSRSGLSKGTFADATVGEVLQAGYGQANYTDGSKENFYFGGVGGSAKGVSLGVSPYLSHVSGTPWYQFQAGLSGDAGVLNFAGGGGSGINSDTLTSCVDHNFH